MNASSLSVMPILATPLGVATLTGAEQLNPALCGLFARRAAAEVSTPRNPLRYCSADDLMEWPEPAVRRLAEGIIGAVHAYVGGVSDISEAQLRSCRLEARAWFSLLRTNGSIPAANYPMTTWCVIYCAAAPAPAPAQDRADSGVVRLYETRLGTTFLDASNATMRIPYAASHYAWRPEPGKMLIFPASLTHEVALLRAAGELVLVTARIRFVAPDQEGFARW
ncbi:MAG TPA: hypothetical protein VHW71_16440 [Steroidobacteraceae bacterium]|jgi:hypothetical protein|nr:hypothetical protein [Steroidobacteraceae bacterium]